MEANRLTALVSEFFSDEVHASISQAINDRVLSTEFTSTTNRVFNIWIEDGLIDDNRPEGKRKRYFSLIETMWIGLVESLREIGYNKDKIRKIKKQLLCSVKGIETPHPFFEFYVIRTILYKVPFYIVVSMDGITNILSTESYISVFQKNEFAGHTVFPVGALFKHLLTKIDQSKWQFEELFSLSEQEIELLAFVKQNDFLSINIIRFNGEMIRLEGIERIASQKRIIDILNEGDYQNIELKQENGKVVSIQRTIKKRLK